MNELRDPLIEAIHAAGEVPPPPDRDAAFARAMHLVLMPTRRRLNRSIIALFAAALLAVPAAVFAERASHTPSATIMQITVEKADPGRSIQHEADDSTLKRERASTRDERSGSATQADDRSGTAGSRSSGTDQSADGTAVTSDGSGGADDVILTPAPTPAPSLTTSSGSLDGGSPDTASSPSADGGSPAPS